MNQPFPGSTVWPRERDGGGIARTGAAPDLDDDGALVLAARRGERDALEQLVVRYQKPLYHLALRMLGNRDDAIEVTQTVFMQAFSRLERYDPAQRFFSWIYRIAINESLDCRAARRPHEPLADDLVLDRPQPDAECERDQREQALQSALLALAPEQRSLVVLKHLLGCSNDQLCQMLDVPLSTVKSRLHAARLALRAACAARDLA